MKQFRLNAIWASIIVAITLRKAAFSFGDTTCTKDPISCALDDITIYIPDIEVPVPPNTILYLKDFTCNEVQIESFPSEFIPPSTIGVDLNGFHIKCVGNYEYHAEIFTYKGVMTAIVEDTSLSIDYLLSKDPYSEFPVSMAFSSCSIPSINFDISFTGGILSGLLNLLSGAVEAFLEKSLNTIVCVDVANFVAKNGTYFLTHELDPVLANLIASKPSLPPPDSAIDPSYFNWQESPFAYASKFSNSTFIDKLGKCAIEHLPANIQDEYMQRPWINGIFQLLTNGTGVLTIPVDTVDVLRPVAKLIIDLILNATSCIPFHIDTRHPYGNITATLKNVEISGFDTFDRIDILQPSIQSNMSLTTVIKLDKFGLNLDYNIMTPDAMYTEDIRITLKLSDIFIDIELGLGLNQTSLSSLFIDQLFHPGCFMQSVGYFNISALTTHVVIDEFSITSIGDHQLAELNADLIALADNVILLVIDGFGELVTDTLQGVMQGPVRDSLNSLVNTWISKAKAGESLDAYGDILPYLFTCPAHRSIPHANIQWWNSTLVQMLNTAVNVNFGASGMNKLIGCMTDHTGKVIYESEYWGVEVGGLDSFSSFRIAAPYKASDNRPFNLVSSIGFGSCDENNLLTSRMGAPFGMMGTPAKMVGSSQCNPFYFKFYSTRDSVSSPSYQWNTEELMYAMISMLTAADDMISLQGGGDADGNGMLTGADKERLITSWFQGYYSTAGSAAGTMNNVEWRCPEVDSLATYVSDMVDWFAPDVKYLLGPSFPDIPTLPPHPPLPPGIMIEFQMSNFYLLLDLLAKMDKAVVEGLRAYESRTRGCMAQAFNQLQFDQFGMSVGNASLTVTYPDGGIHKDLTSSLVKMLSYITRPDNVDNINGQIEEKLARASVVCSNGGVYPDTNDDVIKEATESWTWELVAIIGGAICFFLLFLYLYHHYRELGKHWCMKLLNGGSFADERRRNELIRLKAKQQTKDNRGFYDRWGFQDALCCQHGKFHLLIRVGIVVAIIGNTICFLFSNLDPNVVLVMAKVFVGPKVIEPPPVFAFGLASTVRDSKLMRIILLSFF
jgi:hypothetical protein